MDRLEWAAGPIPLSAIVAAAAEIGLSRSDVLAARDHVARLPGPYAGRIVGVMHARPEPGLPSEPHWFAYIERESRDS